MSCLKHGLIMISRDLQIYGSNNLNIQMLSLLWACAIPGSDFWIIFCKLLSLTNMASDDSLRQKFSVKWSFHDHIAAVLDPPLLFHGVSRFGLKDFGF